MAFSYPISLPAAPAPSGIRITPLAAVAASRSPFTLQQFTYEHAGQAWQAQISYPVMDRAEFEPLATALMKLNGIFGTFLLGVSAITTPRGSELGTPLVDGAGQSGQSLATKGWTANESGVLLAGDFFQLGSGATARLYKALDDVDADAGGLAAIDFWPRLRESPAADAAITTSGCQGLFRLASNELPWEEFDLPFWGLSIEAVEAL